MEKIKAAAKIHGCLKEDRNGYDEQYFNPHGCDKYDAFIAGALAPETEAYYKEKYVCVAGNDDNSSIDLSELDKAKKEVIHLITKGYLLNAIKLWKESNPGMGLREAKEDVLTLYDLYTKNNHEHIT